jgi:hypothetical protein
MFVMLTFIAATLALTVALDVSPETVYRLPSLSRQGRVLLQLLPIQAHSISLVYREFRLCTQL